MRKLLIVAALAVSACTGNHWDPTFKATFQKQMTQTLFVSAGGVISPSACERISACIMDKGEKAFTQAEWITLDNSPNVVGVEIAKQFTYECLCAEPDTKFLATAKGYCK